MNQIEKILLDIENLRIEMYKAMKEENYKITPKIVTISQRLDRLLVEYSRMKL